MNNNKHIKSGTAKSDLIETLNNGSIRIPRNEHLPFILVSVASIITIIAGIISLHFRSMGIFHHIFYFPIILASFFYIKRGLLISSILIIFYYFLMIIFDYKDETQLDLIIHSLNFFLISSVISYLSFKWKTSDKNASSAIMEVLRNEKRLRILLDECSDTVFSINKDGSLLYINRSFIKLTGKTEEYFTGKNMWNMLPDEKPAERVTTLNEVLDKGVEKLIEMRVPYAGEERYYLTTLTPVKDADGAVDYVICIGKDITERRKIEIDLKQTLDNLRESEKLNRIISGLTTDYAFIVDVSPEQKISLRWISDNATEITGRARSTIENFNSWKDIFPDDEYKRFMDFTLHIISDNQPGSIECKTLRQDNKIGWIKIVAYPEKKSDGGLEIYGAVKDVTDRKSAEDELFRFKFMVENASQEVYLVEPDGKIAYVNRAAADSLGFTVNEMLAIHVRDIDPEIGPVFSEYFSKYKKNEMPVFETVHIAKNGRHIRKEIHSVFISLNNSEYICGFGQDITERKRAEVEKLKLQEQLAQSQKMESVGRLAGGVAHDFNNMLGVIIGQTELALLRSDKSGKVYDSLKEIEKAAHRSADLTSQLLAFARKQAVAPKVIDLNNTIGGMISMLRRLIGENIELVWNPGTSLWKINIDPTQIDQILANLCVNSRDAISGNGRITINTENIVYNEDWLSGNRDATPGDFVMLTVNDTGSGFSPDSLKHIFEPFFTTKEMGKGTGLGLAMVYGIVRQNNGFIDVKSKEGDGTAFRIYFPRSDSSSEIEYKQADIFHQTGNETVLLVEDEPMYLDITRSMLETLGYTVMATSSPSEAIEMAREYGDRIKLLITDVIMPGMNGRDMSSRVLEILPGLKRLFMSGYTADVIAHHGVLADDVHFIQKPFTLNSLSEHVKLALGHTLKNAG